MPKRREISPEEMATWEERLKKEGLGAELPPDKAAEALREQAETETGTGDLESLIRKKLQEYWQFRNAFRHGAHKQAAEEIARDLNVPAGAVDIDETLVKSVEEEVAGAQLGLQEAARRIRGEQENIYPKRLENLLQMEAREKYGGISELVIDDIINRLVNG